MTKEEILQKLKESQEKMQDEFIDKLLDEVMFLSEKTNKKEYDPTLHEQEQFRKIVNIINNMAKWF